MTCIPQDDASRKAAPMWRGLLGYFPWALFKLAAHSFRSDRKHNPDKPESEAPHWTRSKSTDHADCIVRHLADLCGPPPADFEGLAIEWEEYHLTAIFWRAGALLQEFGEARRGASPGCRSVFPTRVDQLRDLLHPAQKLAIEAFKADQWIPPTPPAPMQPPPRDRFAGLTGGPDDFPGDEYATGPVR